MKTKLFICLGLLISVNFYSFSPPLSGESVPGAEIYVELEPDDEPIANVQTNSEGEFVFSFPEGKPIPAKGTFKITISPPKNLNKSQGTKLIGFEKQTIKIQFSIKDGPKFKYKLSSDENLKSKSNRGGFAVSGRNNA
ncbi:MAG: carboxypeptidase-like regulatory domain-containing protein [Bacteroidota bacterium]|nr:hypothetical protein [Odoribacter sp.]MDP3642593.1 carboxypeptidase-like regulatory domain-containing protein [Bacteroidota bacterium]